SRTGDEVRRGRPRHGDRRRRDYAGAPGQGRGCDQPRFLVHRSGLLLRNGRSLRALRPPGRAERGGRTTSSRGGSDDRRESTASRRDSGVSGRRRVTIVAAAVAAVVSACGSASPTSPARSTRQLEVVSWWTSRSESVALNHLFATFRKSNPGVTAINAAVAGGAGSNAIVELAKRLQRNDPPDVWQTFAGKSVQGYASRGVIRNVASIFAAEGLSATMNPTILTAVMHDHQPYGVPTGAHRSNVLWFNAKLLERAGVARPSSGYTVDSFIGDLGKVKASGATPLCLGAKDRFTTVELFENTLLSSIGTHGWQHMVHNGLDWRSKQVQTALNNFGAILRYADPEANQLTWDQATKKLATGGCAFESMNDSAYGELIADGAHEGTDFDGVPFPGTQGSFLAVVDVFVAATKAKNARNA